MNSMILRRGVNLLRRPLASAARNLFGTITHFETKDSVVALTFDDGPHPEYTPRLLDLLARYQARATFFMVGESAEKYPELVKKVAEAGHAVANHSWNHPSFVLLSGAKRRAQIRECEKAIAPYGEKLFRPPYGQQSFGSYLDALLLGYEVVAWNLDVGDWWNPDAERMANLLTERIRPGSVLVFHDALFDHGEPRLAPELPRKANVSRESMLIALRMFLERTGKHFSFLTVPALIRQGQAQRTNWYRVN